MCGSGHRPSTRRGTGRCGMSPGAVFRLTCENTSVQLERLSHWKKSNTEKVGDPRRSAPDLGSQICPTGVPKTKQPFSIVIRERPLTWQFKVWS